ncbi:unnamed protein product [Caenorhabditis sp. 36 PRJEB53466]|nr:unnamed protein product [Caenorhabditis sp. 36 PRJEB53466]
MAKNRAGRITLPLIFAAFIVSLGGGFSFGYQLLITNPAEDAFRSFVAESYSLTHGTVEHSNSPHILNLWGVILAMFFWGATIGAFLIQPTSEKLGRKNGLLASFVAQLVAVLLVIFAYTRKDYIIYSISRVISGGAISVSLGIATFFITECSPTHCRGTVSLATAILMQLGLVVGAIVAMPQMWGTSDSWHLIYLVQGAALLISIVGTLFLKEAPTFLASRGKRQEALESFKFYQGMDSSEAETFLEESGSQEEAVGLLGIFRKPEARRGMLVGSVVMGGMIMSGIIAINAFAFKFLLRVGFNALQASIGNIVICVMTVFGVILSSQFIDRYGRRSLLLVTFAILCLLNIVIFICMLLFETHQSSLLGWGVVLAICLFNLVFSAGPCPIAFFITGELVSQNARAAACTWVIVALNLLRSIVLVIYGPIEEALGGPIAYFVLFFPPCVLSVLLIYYCLPETKGKSAEEAAESNKNLPKLCA